MSKKSSRTDAHRCPISGKIEHGRANIDPRAARSRDAIRQAFLALILEKGYDAIDAKMICARAGVSRTTFYAHFADKDDLKRSGIEHMRRQLEHAVADDAMPNAPFGFSLALFEHARDHRKLYRALAGSRGAVVAQEALRDMLRALVQRDVERSPRLAARSPRRLVVDYYASALLGILVSWLDQGVKQSPHDMAVLCQSLVGAG